MVRIFVITYGHDDPRKCSALKMIKLGYATKVSDIRFLPKNCLILNPYSNNILTPLDAEIINNYGIAVVDVSWKNGLEVLKKLSYSKRPQRVLPLLFAGNPINYAVATRLSSMEAVAAALYITGFKDHSLRILSTFKWGQTFYNLNKDLLNLYSQCTSVDEVIKIQNQILRKFNDG
ncbi:MAG: DUF367 family protein [Sulfolobales archaeon]